jgi:hypothetical protein
MKRLPARRAVARMRLNQLECPSLSFWAVFILAVVSAKMNMYRYIRRDISTRIFGTRIRRNMMKMSVIDVVYQEIR